MEGKKIKAGEVTGIVELVYMDAIATGTCEYVTITQLLVRDEKGKCHVIRPRDVEEIIGTAKMVYNSEAEKSH